MTKRTLAVAVVVLSLGGGLARAEVSGQQDSFGNPPPEESVYATDHHLGFSLRSSIIHWLGGVTIVDENDLLASEREKWWGEDVPLPPADVIRADR